MIAQRVRRWSSGHKVVQAEGSSPSGDKYQFFSALIFISVKVRPNGLSYIVTLSNRPNSCYQQNLNWLECFDMPLLSLGLFS